MTIFLLLPLIGNQLCQYRVRLLLSKQKTAPITLTTGWLSGASAVVALVRQRCLPAGWVGFIMIAAWLTSSLSDFAVSGLVRDVQLPGRCTFQQGVAIPTTPVDYVAIPDNQNRLYDTIAQAITTNIRNGGKQGIFGKANSAINFRADDTDVLGRWNCTRDGLPAIFPSSNTPEDVQANLTNSGRLFGNALGGCWGGDPDGSTSRHFLWSASAGDNDLKTWDVKFGINTALSTSNSRPYNMSMYTCQMDAPSVAWVLPRIQIGSTLNAWCQRTQGDVFNPFSPELPENSVSWVLESMVMVGFGNVVELPDATQGCLMTKTQIPWEVCALLGFVTVMFVALLALCAGYFAYLSAFQKRLSDADRWAVINATPQGLLGWIGQAIREHDTPANAVSYSTMVEPRDFRRWQFGINRGGDNVVYGLHLGEDPSESQIPLMYTKETHTV